MAKRKKTIFEKISIGLACFFGFIVLVLVGAVGYFRLSVLGYYQISKAAFPIPALNQNFVPQGISYDQRTESFFLTGYDKGGKASPVFVVKGKTAKKVLLADQKGGALAIHSGGLTVHGDYIYVADSLEQGLHVFSYQEIVKAKDGDSVKSLGLFETKLSSSDDLLVACTTVKGNQLVVAEFYLNENTWSTPQSHHFTTKAGDENKALAFAYDFDDKAPFGLKATPSVAYSIPNQAQGICFDGNDCYFSTSYGVAFSHIYKHSVDKFTKMDDLKVNGASVPFYAIDSASLVADLKAAPMSEEIEIVDGKLYTMCESASNQYIFGKITWAWDCYATDLTKIK